MKVATKLSIATTAIVIICFAYYVSWITEELKPNQRSGLEDALVDQAVILASTIDTTEGINFSNLKHYIKNVLSINPNATIYGRVKDKIDIRVYITNQLGIVLYDSSAMDEGKDFSKWNDVHLTLKGLYGARTSKEDSNPKDSMLYVGVPLIKEGQIIGVLSLGKSARNVNILVNEGKSRIILMAILSGVAIISLILLSTALVTKPIRQLTNHALKIRDGHKSTPPKVSSSDIASLSDAFEQMRNTLEGKLYVEHYTQTLTHEIKSPLTSIRAAAELLSEEPAEEQKNQFINAIVDDCKRIQQIIDSMLLLASIENRSGLQNTETIDFKELVLEIVERLSASFQQKSVRLENQAHLSLVYECERFLISQAIINLLQNALDFTPPGGLVTLSLNRNETEILIEVCDNGVGIPDYAECKIFDRFYSLTRPNTNKKSSGLGLSFVQEVIALHGGSLSVKNRQHTGVIATISLPCKT